MMEEQINHIDYSHAIKAIKNAILQSRYNAAKLVNKEILSLYYCIGEYIAQNSHIGFWGTNAIKFISDRLQKELPGLRGFSETSLKKMRTFYEEWNGVFSNRPLLTDKLNSDDLDSFISIGFTHHYELLLKTTSLEERLFYIQKCAREFWSVEKLKYYLKDNLFIQQSTVTSNNFFKYNYRSRFKKPHLAYI